MSDKNTELAASPRGGPAVRRRAWYDEASRWTQLTFAEDDPLHFDLDAWRDVMVRTRSNAICLSAGGYIAYYPTRVPHHYVSRHLGDADLFGSVVEVARSLSMKVMARVDPHAVHADAAAAHPEWLARASDGTALEHPSQHDVWITCAHTAYHSDFLTEVSREIVREYDVDAIFANRWEGPMGISYSDAARHSFRSETGLELPHAEPSDHPVWRTYAEWRGRRLGRLITTWDAAVRDVRPNARFIPNRGPFQLRTIDPQVIDRATPAFFIDKQGRAGDEAVWAAGRVGKRSKGAYPDRPVNLITSVGPEQHMHRWKDSVDAPAELVTAIADGILHEANPWFTKFNARIVDTRWIAPVAEAFHLHATVEEHYRTSTARPEVVILEAVEIDESDLATAYLANFPDEDGVYQALLEARIPFGYVPDIHLDLDRLDGVRVVVLPDARSVTHEQADVLRQFVARGGGIVATDRSTLSDESHGDFALADVLGVRRAGARRDGVKNNYMALIGSHEVHAGYEGAARILGGTAIVPIEAGADADVPFRFIPDFPDLPMEEVYPREAPRDAAVVCRRVPGGGRAAYAAFDLGAVYWEAMQQDHGRLIVNLVDWALGQERRVRLTGVGLVDVAVRDTRDGVLVGLVNLDNPMAMRGQLHWLRPLAPQTLSVALPRGASGADARLVVGGQSLEVHIEEGRAAVELPETAVLELVKITWHHDAG